jgi:hypothetical protein
LRLGREEIILSWNSWSLLWSSIVTFIKLVDFWRLTLFSQYPIFVFKSLLENSSFIVSPYILRHARFYAELFLRRSCVWNSCSFISNLSKISFHKPCIDFRKKTASFISFCCLSMRNYVLGLYWLFLLILLEIFFGLCIFLNILLFEHPRLLLSRHSTFPLLLVILNLYIVTKSLRFLLRRSFYYWLVVGILFKCVKSWKIVMSTHFFRF